MVYAWCRMAVATLAAGAALAGVAVGQDIRRSVRIGGSTLSLPEHEAMRLLVQQHATSLSGGATCCRVSGNNVLSIQDVGQPDPACIVICPQGQAEAAAVAERYQRLMRLQDYRCDVAPNGSLAFLQRKGVDLPYPLQRHVTLEVLSENCSLLPVVQWICTACSSTPVGMEGSTLLWRMPVRHGNKEGEMEISLELQHGVPSPLGVRLHGISQRHILPVLAQYLQLRLEAPARSLYLRRCPQVRLAGQTEGEITVQGRKQRVRVCLLQPAAGEAFFHLGEREKLLRLYEGGQMAEPPALAQFREIPWADELPQALPPAPAAEPAPAPKIPTPQEAREEYARRLRAL